MIQSMGISRVAARNWSKRHVVAAIVASCFMALASAAAAEDVATAVPSLKLVPQDAAFYQAMLNGREQVEIVAKSNFWKKVQQLDWYKQAQKSVAEALQQPDNPASRALNVLELPENQQAVAVVREMFSDEVFSYANADACDTLKLVSEVSNTMRFGNMLYELSERSVPQEEYMMRLLFNTLNNDIDLIKIPDVVVGFRIRSPEPAEEQLRRLEAYITVMMENVPELAPYKNKFKRKKVGDAQYITITIDGSVIPWDKVPFEDIAEKPGQFDKLRDKLKGLQMVVSLGIQQGYIVLSIGKSTDHLATLGKGPSLLDDPHLKMLRDKGAQHYTAIAYHSAKFADSTGLRAADIDEWTKLAEQMLPSSKLPKEDQKKIIEDVKSLGSEVKDRIPKAGPEIQFAYLTPRGIETYSSNWSENPYLDGSKKLTIATHLGSTPLLAVAARGHYRPQDYDLLVKVLVKGRGYFEKYGLPEMSEREQAQYKQFAEIAYPLLVRLDTVHRTMIVPALADGQSALVIDTGLKSKQWHENMPETADPAALPLPALVLGVSDVALLEQAMTEYRAIANELIKKVRPFVPPNVPEFDLPPAKIRKVEPGQNVYYYPLPKEFGVDKQLAPNAGLSPNFLVLSLSPRLTVDLLKSQPLATAGEGPLGGAADRSAAIVVSFDWVQLVDAALPWVNEGVRTYMHTIETAFRGPDEGNDGGKEPKPGDSEMTRKILTQVKEVCELLKAFRGATAVAYVEDGAVVTHSEARFVDVP